MKIAFDLDGTLFTQGNFANGYRDAEPIKEMIEFVNKLYNEGHEIYIFTARHFHHYVYTDESLKTAGLKYHGLILGKFPYDLLIDDRAIRFDTTEKSKERNLFAIKKLIEKLELSEKENKNDNKKLY